jgi:hypothetical protein
MYKGVSPSIFRIVESSGLVSNNVLSNSAKPHEHAAKIGQAGELTVDSTLRCRKLGWRGSNEWALCDHRAKLVSCSCNMNVLNSFRSSPLCSCVLPSVQCNAQCQQAYSRSSSGWLSLSVDKMIKHVLAAVAWLSVIE